MWIFKSKKFKWLKIKKRNHKRKKEIKIKINSILNQKEKMVSLTLQHWPLKTRKNSIKKRKKRLKNRNCYKNMKKIYLKGYFLMEKARCGRSDSQLWWLLLMELFFQFFQFFSLKCWRPWLTFKMTKWKLEKMLTFTL